MLKLLASDYPLDESVVIDFPVSKFAQEFITRLERIHKTHEEPSWIYDNILDNLESEVKICAACGKMSAKDAKTVMRRYKVYL